MFENVLLFTEYSGHSGVIQGQDDGWYNFEVEGKFYLINEPVSMSKLVEN